MWGRNATFKSGNPDSDTHQAFNPMIEGQSITFPKRVIELITTCESLYPNIEYDKQRDPSTVTFKTIFRSPFMLMTPFTNKTVPGAWTGTEDTISADFTSRGDIDNNIWVVIHLEDATGNGNHINLFLDGGQVVEYRWTWEQGGYLQEEVDIMFAEVSETAYLPDIADGFDGAQFNRTGVAEVSTITAVAASSITNNTYFFIYLADGTGGQDKYHVWFNKDGAGVDPAPSGSTAIAVAVTTGQTAGTIATAIGAALDGAADNFGTPAVDGAVVTVTQQQQGDITDIIDNNSGLTLATTTQGETPIDGGWDQWDGEVCTSSAAVIPSTVVTATFAGSAPDGIDIMGGTLTLKFPKQMQHIASAQDVDHFFEEVRGPWECSLRGILSGNNPITEIIATLANKTEGTLKVAYNAGADKYLQFTNAVLMEPNEVEIAAAGKNQEIDLKYVGTASSALTFSWTGTEATDPTSMITAS